MQDTADNRILIIDDDPGVIHMMTQLVREMKFETDSAISMAEGLKKAQSQIFDIVLLDVNLPDGNGVDFIGDILATPFPPQVIMMTAYSDPDGAELAIKNGAWDYISKPSSVKEIRFQITKAMQYRLQRKEAEKNIDFNRDQIIGDSRCIQRCLLQAAQAAQSDAPLLITGKTGTGKELFAKAIHHNSPRSKEGFVVVDCSILTENLIESVLFGHKKGAFTGADRDRKGLIELADKGTLFLDEIGELPGSIQSSFLRVLQEKRFRPIGGEKELFSDFRVICATNKNLEQMVTANQFRSDLFYRLKTLALHLPPLQKRKDDIRLIALDQARKSCNAHKIPEKKMSPEYIETLENHTWPGNVRELINTVENSVTTAKYEDVLLPFHIPARIRAKIVRNRIDNTILNNEESGKTTGRNWTALTHSAFIYKMEKQYLEAMFEFTGGDIARQIEKTGLSRSSLYRKLKQYQIQ